MPADRSFLSDLKVVLRGADFRKLFAVRLVSQSGDGAFQVGLASLVFFSPDRATTPSAVALAAVVTVLPYTLIGPFAGVLLDVWPRRQVLLWANALRSLMVVGVAALIASGEVGVPLYLAALACLSVNRFFLAGLGASLPLVVPRHELVMANAVSPTSGTVFALGGAAIAYGVRLLLGPGNLGNAAILLAAAAGYATSAALATRMPRHLLGPRERAPLSWSSATSAARDVRDDMRDGARHLRARPAAGRALALIGAHRLGYGVLTIGLMLLCRNYFNDPADVDDGLALLAGSVTATGLGIALAALLTPWGAARFEPWRWMGGCVATAATVIGVFVVHLDVVVLIVGVFLLGLTSQGTKICVDAVVQGSVDDAFRGRVFAFYDVVFNAAFVAAAGIAVVALPADGYSRSLLTGVGLLFTTAAVTYLAAEHRAHRTPVVPAPAPAEREPGPASGRPVTPATRPALTDDRL